VGKRASCPNFHMARRRTAKKVRPLLRERSVPDYPFLIWVAMAPIPVLPLFTSMGFSEFVRVSVVLRKEYPPVAIFVVVPIVIVLVVSIVDADLNGLWRGSGHD
jgi:hypothetical protein